MDKGEILPEVEEKNVKRVLIIAYYFPPLGLGGVQRALKFVRYLPENGWNPVVLTTGDILYHAYDESLVGEIKGARVVRFGKGDPLRLMQKINRKNQGLETNRQTRAWNRFNRRAARWIFIPDSKIAWALRARQTALRLCKEFDPHLIFSTSPPHSSHLLGLFLKTETGIPWVADFRDNWLAEPHERAPTVFHRTVRLSMLKRVMAGADSVITVSAPIAGFLEKFRQGPDPEVEIIPNGFDPADFEDLRHEEPENFTITYSGTLYADRRPDVFLRAVSLAIKQCPSLEKKLCVQLVGRIMDMDIEREIRNAGLENQVEVMGYRSHREAVVLLKQSHLLLLLISPESSEGVVTGKLFEYLASGVHILAAVPEGEAAEIVRKTSRGFVVNPVDARAQADVICRCFQSWSAHRLKPAADPMSGLEHYNRKHLTARLAGLMDRIVRKKRMEL